QTAAALAQAVVIGRMAHTAQPGAGQGPDRRRQIRPFGPDHLVQGQSARHDAPGPAAPISSLAMPAASSKAAKSAGKSERQVRSLPSPGWISPNCQACKAWRGNTLAKWGLPYKASPT